MNVPFALGVTSGTSALRVALAALDIEEDDEVITQSFTFVATVEAIIESRAIPIITEIDKTLNLCVRNPSKSRENHGKPCQKQRKPRQNRTLKPLICVIILPGHLLAPPPQIIHQHTFEIRRSAQNKPGKFQLKS